MSDDVIDRVEDVLKRQTKASGESGFATIGKKVIGVEHPLLIRVSTKDIAVQSGHIIINLIVDRDSYEKLLRDLQPFVVGKEDKTSFLRDFFTVQAKLYMDISTRIRG